MAPAFEPLADAFRKRFPRVALTRVGTVGEGEGVVLCTARGERPLEGGFDHFARGPEA